LSFFTDDDDCFGFFDVFRRVGLMMAGVAKLPASLFRSSVSGSALS